MTKSKGGARTFSITELAREFDVTTRSIRVYEDQGRLMMAIQMPAPCRVSMPNPAMGW